MTRRELLKLCGVMLPLVAASLLLTANADAQAPAASLEVFPREAAQLTPMELGDFIAYVLPKEGLDTLSWDYLVDGRLKWITDGIEEGTGENSRTALVRLRLQGAPAVILRQVREELAWTFKLVTEGNPKFGPTFLRLSVDCFGDLVIPFDSPSAAAAVIAGRNENGRQRWRVVGTGQTYAEWQQGMIPTNGCSSLTSTFISVSVGGAALLCTSVAVARRSEATLTAPKYALLKSALSVVISSPYAPS
jgi:hypothetical protein